MDNEGNMMVKKLAKSNVFVRYANGENAVGSDILKLPQAALEANKGLTVSRIGPDPAWDGRASV